MSRITSLLLLILVSFACNKSKKADPYIVAATTGDFIQVIIEIPAGTNHKIEFDYATGEFKNDQTDGEDRVIDFLPYPGNYGFIPGTLMEKERGGDGDALDVLVIGEAVPTASLMQVKPIGALVLNDRGEIDTKLIGIPADPKLQVIKADGFMDFSLRYDAARRIIEDWFQNYKGDSSVEIVRWEDEDYAWAEVRKWLKK
jgi:inorganic pyrophosphatase